MHLSWKSSQIFVFIRILAPPLRIQDGALCCASQKTPFFLHRLFSGKSGWYILGVRVKKENHQRPRNYMVFNWKWIACLVAVAFSTPHYAVATKTHTPKIPLLLIHLKFLNPQTKSHLMYLQLSRRRNSFFKKTCHETIVCLPTEKQTRLRIALTIRTIVRSSNDFLIRKSNVKHMPIKSYTRQQRKNETDSHNWNQHQANWIFLCRESKWKKRKEEKRDIVLFNKCLCKCQHLLQI